MFRVFFILAVYIITASGDQHGKIKPQVRSPLRIRNYRHHLAKEQKEIYQKYGYQHVKKKSRGSNMVIATLPAGDTMKNYDQVKKYLSEHKISPRSHKHKKWMPPLPPIKERSGIWSPTAPVDKTHYRSSAHKKRYDILDYEISKQLRAHCTTGPTVTYRTYRRDIAENFRYLVGATIYTLSMNSSLVLRPSILDYPRIKKSSNKTNDMLEFGCFPPTVKKKGSAHRLFLLAASMQGCMEPIAACPNPAFIPSLYTSIKSHHLNTRNTVIDWNVWEDKSNVVGIYGEIMEMSVNDYLYIPSIRYNGSRWVLVRSITKRLWRLSPHMKRLAKKEKNALARKVLGASIIGVHLTPLRSSPSKLAGVGGPPGIFSSTLKSTSSRSKESPFAIYIMAMERIWKKQQQQLGANNKTDGNRNKKYAFVYASNMEEIEQFKKQAKEKGNWEIFTLTEAMSSSVNKLHMKTIFEVLAVDIMSEFPYFIGAASSGVSWTIQAVRKQPLSTGISLDDPWSQRI